MFPLEYLATRQSVSDGASSGIQGDQLGNLRSTLETLQAGERLAGGSTGNDYTAVKFENTYTAISTATTTLIKTGSGHIHTITIAGGTLGAITVYDNTAGSGTPIIPTFTPTATLPCPPIILDEAFATGLTIVTAAATIINVSSQ